MEIPEGWPTEEMVAAGFEVVRQAAPNERAFRIALFRAMLAAAPTPPAQEDEPVACQIRLATDYECDTWHEAPAELFERYSKDTQWQVRKVYTRPADDKLRKTAEEIIFQFDLSCRESACFGSVERIENLRAALEGK